MDELKQNKTRKKNEIQTLFSCSREKSGRQAGKNTQRKKEESENMHTGRRRRRRTNKTNRQATGEKTHNEKKNGYQICFYYPKPRREKPKRKGAEKTHDLRIMVKAR